MRLATLPTDVAVASAATDLLADTVKSRPAAVVIVPAGRTPLLLFAEILRRARRGALDLRRVRFFQLDEYVGTGPADPRSFAALLQSCAAAGCRLSPLHNRFPIDIAEGAARESAELMEERRLTARRLITELS